MSEIRFHKHLHASQGRGRQPAPKVWLVGWRGRRLHPVSELPGAGLLHLTRLAKKSGHHGQMPRRVSVEQPISVLSKWRPDPLNPFARMLGELDACGASGLKPCITSQLKPLKSCRDDAAACVEDGRKLFGRSRASKEQSGHAWHVRAIDRQNLCREIVEDDRCILQSGDRFPDGVSQAGSTRGRTTGSLIVLHDEIISVGANKINRATRTNSKIQQDAAISRKTERARREILLAKRAADALARGVQS